MQITARTRTNILFVLNSFGTGGSERVVLDLCQGLNRDSFKPSVASLHDGELRKKFEELDIRTFSLNKKEGGLDVGLMLRLSRLVRELEVDVINAHHFSPFIHSCGSAIVNHRPLIYEEHTAYEIQQIPRYWSMIGTVLLKTCCGVIGISKDCTEQLRRTFHVPAFKAITVLNAVDLNRFGGTKDQHVKRKEFGLGPDEKVLGVIGNLRPQKNHSNLLRAFKIVRKECERARLLIVGDGPMMDQLVRLSVELGVSSHVHFLGARLDAPDIYKTLDVYCLSSHYEGLPLTILEAMVSKIPIVATNVIGIKDLVVPGKTGLLVEPDNPEKLAQALLRLINHPEEGEQLAKDAYRYVEENHRMGPWVQTYEDIFLRAVQGRYGYA